MNCLCCFRPGVNTPWWWTFICAKCLNFRDDFMEEFDWMRLTESQVELTRDEANFYYNCRPEVITTLSYKLFTKIMQFFSEYELRELRLVCKTFDSFLTQMLPVKNFTLLRTEKHQMFLQKERIYRVLKPKRCPIALEEVLNFHQHMKVDKVVMDLTKNPDLSLLKDTILEQTVEHIEIEMYDVHDAHKFFTLRILKRSVKSLVVHGGTYYLKRLITDFLEGENALEFLSDGEHSYKAPEIRRKMLSDMRKSYPEIKTDLD